MIAQGGVHCSSSLRSPSACRRGRRRPTGRAGRGRWRRPCRCTGCSTGDRLPGRCQRSSAVSDRAHQLGPSEPGSLQSRRGRMAAFATRARRTPACPPRDRPLDQRLRQPLALDAVVEAAEHPRGVLEDRPAAQVRTGRAGCARRCAPSSDAAALEQDRVSADPPIRTRAPGSCRATASVAARGSVDALEQARVAEQDVGVAGRESLEARAGAQGSGSVCFKVGPDGARESEG